MAVDQRRQVDPDQLPARYDDAAVDDRKVDPPRLAQYQPGQRVVQPAGERELARVERDEVRAAAWLDDADVVAAQQARAAQDGQLERLRRREGVGAVVHALQQHRVAHFIDEVRGVVRGASVHADGDGRPGLQEVGHPAAPGGRVHVRVRAVRDAGVGAPHPRHIAVAQAGRMRVPHVGSDPAPLLSHLDRRVAVAGVHVRLVLGGLSEVGVAADAVSARQLDALAHHPRGDGEGRSGRQVDARHRARLRVVIGLDQALAIGQDVVFLLDLIVRRDAALALPHRAAAAQQVEADAGVAGRLDAGVEADVVDLEVMMVRRRRAARQQQLGVIEQRRGVQILIGQLAHQPAEIAQPGEQRRVLQGRDVAEQALELMMMGVDQPRQDDAAGEIEAHLGGRRGLIAAAHGLDQVVVDEHPGIAQPAPVCVERRQGVDVMEEQAGHDDHPQECATRMRICSSQR